MQRPLAVVSPARQGRERQRRSRVLPLIVLLAAGIPGCAREAARESVTAGVAYDQAAAAEAVPPAPQAPPPARSDAAPADQAAVPAPMPRKLVKTVDLELRVRDTRGSTERLGEVAQRLGGYLSAMNGERRNDLLYYSLTLRIPVERLEEAVAAAKQEAESVERESMRTEDVTERYVDLEARLKTLRATEEELRQLLAESRERGQDVEAIMAVYRQLTEIRTQIEGIQGQLQALAGLAALSTVNVRLMPTEAAKPIVAEGWRPGDTLRGAVRTLVRALQGLADVAIGLLVVGLPLLLVVVLPFWLVWRLLRRWWRRTPPPA
jgi:hypothetical protein